MFINTAVVPRVERDRDGNEMSYFVRTNWREGECQSVEEVWVDTHGNECSATPVTFESIDESGPEMDGADEQ